MTNLKEEFKQACVWTKEISEKEANTYDCGGPGFNRLTNTYTIETDCSDEKNGALCFFNDDDFDSFTGENDLTVWHDEKERDSDHLLTIKAVEKACDCKITWNEQFEGEEVIFNSNHKRKVYNSAKKKIINGNKHKYCSQCKSYKSLNKFYKNLYICKQCRAKVNKKQTLRNKDRGRKVYQYSLDIKHMQAIRKIANKQRPKITISKKINILIKDYLKRKSFISLLETNYSDKLASKLCDLYEFKNIKSTSEELNIPHSSLDNLNKKSAGASLTNLAKLATAYIEATPPELRKAILKKIVFDPIKKRKNILSNVNFEALPKKHTR